MNSPTPKTGKDMTGFIGKNNYKNNEKQPDWKGVVRIKGEEYPLALWLKDGNPDVMRIVVNEPGQTNGRPASASGAGAAPAAKPAGGPIVDDPFGGSDSMFDALPGS